MEHILLVQYRNLAQESPPDAPCFVFQGTVKALASGTICRDFVIPLSLSTQSILSNL